MSEPWFFEVLPYRPSPYSDECLSGYLLRLAEVNEKELDRRLKTAVSFAEPLMLFVMAALVGTIVIGMLLPIFNLQELIN